MPMRAAWVRAAEACGGPVPPGHIQLQPEGGGQGVRKRRERPSTGDGSGTHQIGLPNELAGRHKRPCGRRVVRERRHIL
eukprot:scaffold3377_cov105-Isochrysis_galbana.AAC.2